jgi:import inner membrane translocase subunit TIM50
LDLEKTLIGSVHDAKYGWRHVKRPGVQKFIDRLSNYYEIVIFSENEKNMDIFEAIDPQNKCHKFGAESAESRNGVMLKRLDYMNRDMSRIVLIDDSEETSSLFPRNTLIIRPFSDINDKSDTALLELLPLLQALVHDGVTDFRKTFDDLGTNDATEATLEYRMRVSKAKEGIKEKRRKGLGSLLSKRVDARTGGGSSDGGWDAEGGGGGGGASLLSRIVGDAPVGTASMAGMDASGKQSTTIIDLAGAGAGAHTKVGASTDPSSKKRVKKKGALFQWLEDSQQESEKIRELKMQRMNEIHMEKMQKKEAAARGK